MRLTYLLFVYFSLYFCLFPVIQDFNQLWHMKKMKEDISSITIHWNVQSWKSETSIYHLYLWKKNNFAVECLHDISHPRQFLIRSLWDGHQVQAKVLDLCGQVRLSIVLVISDFFGMESTLKSLHDWAVHDKVPGLGGVGGQIESAVHVDVQTPVQVTHLGKGEESLWKS